MPKNAKIGELTLSRTQILDYLGCGYRWDLSYRRGIQSTKVREAMDVGSAVHMAIKYAVHLYAAGGKWTEVKEARAISAGVSAWAMAEIERRGDYITEELDTQIQAIRDDACGIAAKALESIRLTDWEVASWQGKPLCEVELMVPLPPWKGYRTIPDLVARHKSAGKKAPWWLIDWKCRASFDEDDAEEVNLQFTTMQLVVEEVCGLEIEGSILWQVRSAQPREPKLNQNGTMSRADIVSDWATYEAALIANHLNPADYADMKEKLSGKEWFRAIVQHRSTDECTAVWASIVLPAASAMARDPQVIRRWNYTVFCCRGCWAKDFCHAEMFGSDTEFLLETDYMDTRNPRKMRQLGEPHRSFTLK